MIDGRSLSGAAMGVFIVAVTAVLLGAGLDSSASFSDSVRLGRNELVAGTVDLSLGDSATPVVVENLAPGDQSVLALELRNDGTLPIIVTPTISQEGAEPVAELEVRSWLGQSCQDELGGGGSNDDDPVFNQESRLAPGETGNFCFAVSLPLSAPNSAQGRTQYFTIILVGVHDVTEARDPDQSEGQ